MFFFQTRSLSEDEENQEWRVPLMCGKIKTLIGHAHLELGQIKEASESFYEAMTLYGYPFPTKNSTIAMRTRCLELKQICGIYMCSSLIRSNMEGYDAEFCDNVSECLALMCTLFLVRSTKEELILLCHLNLLSFFLQQLEMWDKAELAAAWSLAKALQSEMDFYKLCLAYSNMIRVCHYVGRNNLCIGLEIEALRLCHKKRSSVESQELTAIAKMYASIFFAR